MFHKGWAENIIVPWREVSGLQVATVKMLAIAKNRKTNKQKQRVLGYDQLLLGQKTNSLPAHLLKTLQMDE